MLGSAAYLCAPTFRQIDAAPRFKVAMQNMARRGCRIFRRPWCVGADSCMVATPIRATSSARSTLY